MSYILDPISPSSLSTAIPDSLLAGVRHNEEPLPLVGRPEVRGSDTEPFRIVPCFGQVAEYSAKVPVSKEAWDVLQQRESGSYRANDSDGLRPEVPLVSLSAMASSNRERLTGEPRHDEVNGGELISNCSNIGKSWDVGPVSFKNLPPIPVDLYLPSGLPSGQLEPEVHAADAGEQAPESRGQSSTSIPSAIGSGITIEERNLL